MSARAGAPLLLLLTVGCSERIELLTPPPDLATADHASPADLTAPPLALCPTSIDVFGGGNVQLLGCGGGAPLFLDDGLYLPGSSAYEATLAGRLRASLLADREVTARLGKDLRLRSCATFGTTFSGLVPPLPLTECSGLDAPPQGDRLRLCLNRPAPVALLIVADTTDRCHGGGDDTVRLDDEATFVNHLTQRLEAFLTLRRPQLLIVALAPEWYGGGAEEWQRGCRWRRLDWVKGAVRSFAKSHLGDPRVRVIDGAGDEWKRHHRCCKTLGLPCERDYFGGSPSGTILSCDGARAVADYWPAQLKRILLDASFRCP